MKYNIGVCDSKFINRTNATDGFYFVLESVQENELTIRKDVLKRNNLHILGAESVKEDNQCECVMNA